LFKFMVFWKTVHWFATSKCNEKCKFCFRPRFEREEDDSLAIAETLADSPIRQAIFTGGEPLLLGKLEDCLRILGGAGIYTGIHTNGILLTPERADRLSELADEIALPLDSMDRETQGYLRGKDCLPQIKRALKQLQNKKVRIGIHTVATAENIGHIPSIYRYLRDRRFDYWRIYQFNRDLVSDHLKSVARFLEVQRLYGRGATEEDGGVNCLFADFLLMEEKMSVHKDKRVQFVGIHDYDRTYFFLGPNGDVYMATWFSQGRKPIGNLLEEGFKRVKDRAVREEAKGPFFDEEDFIDAEQDKPLWARAAWEGSYFSEELDDVKRKHHRKFVHLSGLYLDRLKKQGAAPKDAEFCYTYTL
jgi:MoaA/NifB/PqqE/SkfB family radical SAM enzyme